MALTMGTTGIEVEYITLGDCASLIKVPSGTLRHWSDQLEERNVHFLHRNNRNERIYFPQDISLFSLLRDWKEEYGRRTTIEDLCRMLRDREEQDANDDVQYPIVLRRREDAPQPVKESSNRVSELLGHEDIKRLMDSERVRQFMSVVVSETTKNVRDSLVKEFDDKFEDTHEKIFQSFTSIEQRQQAREEESMKKQQAREEEWLKRMDARFEQTNKYIAELRAKRQAKWWEFWK